VQGWEPTSTFSEIFFANPQELLVEGRKEGTKKRGKPEGSTPSLNQKKLWEKRFVLQEGVARKKKKPAHPQTAGIKKRASRAETKSAKTL